MNFAVPFAAIILAACGSSHDASDAGDVAPPPRTSIDGAIAQSDVLKDAQDAIDRRHPWRATQIIAPVLTDPKKRTPAAVLVAARAAAAWGGWSVVEKLLANEPWIDSQFDGEARDLLTRAAFDRGADTAALTHARAMRAANGSSP